MMAANVQVENGKAKQYFCVSELYTLFIIIRLFLFAIFMMYLSAPQHKTTHTMGND